MTLPESIELVRRHNRWRRDDETLEMVNPTQLGIALELVANAAEDAARLDWLERNLLTFSCDRNSSSLHMDGTAFSISLDNEARGRGAGPSSLRFRATTLRQAIDRARHWTPS